MGEGFLKDVLPTGANDLPENSISEGGGGLEFV